ncbi:sigma 54-interacting transcriptional regulator [Alcaligenes endophyticus]|uniref:Sigma-54 dependent transcriptional regulator n=1 Tax=Alcaligenes endophyticus TaxID=1929088 RepID=A0ABT8EHE1_9BURK|nr:sigma-54 dependent transcriptional regulator [Alcaligenes endophyticus]MCX5592057.1 sigma-54 dependent transcriptional regulator [Alcaligenes endophyticus]MDN4120704.1 sigma-54 dependent transcriptional regulator [Alcaligenes endophyticus]
MSSTFLSNEPILYVWEGSSDLALRAERAMDNTAVAVLRVDAGVRLDRAHYMTEHAVALVSVSVMADGIFDQHEWLVEHAIPVIWVASQERTYDPRFYPSAYSYTLPLSFSAADLRNLVAKLSGLVMQAELPLATGTRPMVAVSPVMRGLLAEVELYADSQASVLIHGETGVGKERIAQLLHDRSKRAKSPFVPVNCGAVPEGLFEAHFFGHAKGAFTGAIGAHKGYFEQADTGTLFLDEIGDLPLHQQVKLLRVIEQRSVTRLGAVQEIPVDFRLVAASNKNLIELVQQGQFRADLYYRLAVVELRIPSLEERGAEEKIAIFTALLEQELQSDVEDIPQWVLDSVGSMRFDGNVRELANLVERVALMNRQFGAWESVQLQQVLSRFGRLGRHAPSTNDSPTVLATIADQSASIQVELERLSEVEREERERIVQALDKHAWRRQDTAAYLGISRKVLWEKMRKLTITAQVSQATG